MTLVKRKEIGYKLRSIRERKKYTQEFVAEGLGMSPINYGRIERGEASLAYEDLQKLSEIFEMEISDIINFEDRYTFNSCNHSNNGNIAFPEEMKKLYEDKIKLLEEKIEYLERKSAPGI